MRGDTVGLGTIYMCDVTHKEILDALFSGEELNYYELILEGEAEIIDDESEFNGEKHMI